MMHSRLMLILSALIVGACTLWAFFGGSIQVAEPPQGFVAHWGDALALPQNVSFSVAVLLNVGIVLFMLSINKVYSLLRGVGVTRLQPSVFLAMQLAVPMALCTLSSGALLAFVVLWALNLMYSIYGTAPGDTSKVFGVFAMFSACSMFDYSYVVYALVMVVACLQLRVFSLRCALAIVLGVVTPWIILFGFGIINPEQLQMPYTGLTMPSGSKLLTAGAVFTAFVALMALSNNLMKYIAYNAWLRSMIGVITLLTLVTIAALVLDASHLAKYMVMLNVCASFQVAHLFTAIYNYGRPYIAIIILYLLYIAFFVLNMLSA